MFLTRSYGQMVQMKSWHLVDIWSNLDWSNMCWDERSTFLQVGHWLLCHRAAHCSHMRASLVMGLWWIPWILSLFNGRASKRGLCCCFEKASVEEHSQPRFHTHSKRRKCYTGAWIRDDKSTPKSWDMAFSWEVVITDPSLSWTLLCCWVLSGNKWIVCLFAGFNQVS